MSELFDVAIVGGGMVGASLAVALRGLNLRVALIEAVAYDAASQPSFDERTTALSNGSRRILQTLGLWPQVSSQAAPIAQIHVSERGRFGSARIDAAEQGLEAMGYVLPNRALGAALWAEIARSGHVQALCPMKVSRVTARTEDVLLELAHLPETGAARESIRARLVVAADGIDSAVRSAFGVSVIERDYGQTALITSVLPQKFHDHVAYERFTSEGPLALLPLTDGRCTLVLTLSHAVAAAAMAWSDEEFLSEVQRRFGFRLGRFLQTGKRVPYRLSLTRALRTSADRCVILGNAAQALHPVAGMGFNLGLRDAACLAELLAERPQHLNHVELLSAYDAWRAPDRAGLATFTDGLVRVFSNPLAAGLRNLALIAFDLLPPAKSALSSLSTGALRRIPKLARGVALAPAP
jgi:2-octaprenyl-6-methoxyphenol hydroxylase